MSDETVTDETNRYASDEFCAAVIDGQTRRKISRLLMQQLPPQQAEDYRFLRSNFKYTIPEALRAIGRDDLLEDTQ